MSMQGDVGSVGGSFNPSVQMSASAMVRPEPLSEVLQQTAESLSSARVLLRRLREAIDPDRGVSAEAEAADVAPGLMGRAWALRTAATEIGSEAQRVAALVGLGDFEPF